MSQSSLTKFNSPTKDIKTMTKGAFQAFLISAKPLPLLKASTRGYGIKSPPIIFLLLNSDSGPHPELLGRWDIIEPAPACMTIIPQIITCTGNTEQQSPCQVLFRGWVYDCWMKSLISHYIHNTYIRRRHFGTNHSWNFVFVRVYGSMKDLKELWNISFAAKDYKTQKKEVLLRTISGSLF